MHTGRKIKILRTIRGLTQEQLAEKINKTRALVSSIEQTGKVNYYTLQSILKVLEINNEDFEAFEMQSTDKKITNPYDFATKNDILILKEKIENYQKENDLLKKLVDSQQKIIQSLEEKRGK